MMTISKTIPNNVAADVFAVINSEGYCYLRATPPKKTSTIEQNGTVHDYSNLG